MARVDRKETEKVEKKSYRSLYSPFQGVAVLSSTPAFLPRQQQNPPPDDVKPPAARGGGDTESEEEADGGETIHLPAEDQRKGSESYTHATAMK